MSVSINRVKRSMFYRIHPPFLSGWGRPSEPVYETPLIEVIIRKGMSKTHKGNVHIVNGYYSYQPSQSYFNYVSKKIPLKGKNVKF